MPAIALKLFAHSFQVVVGKFLSEKSFSWLETWRRAEDHHHRAPLRDNHSSTAPPIQTFKKKFFRFFSFETMIGFVSKNCWHKAKDITHSSSSLGLLSFEALLNKNILIFCLKNAPKMSFLRAAKCSCRRRQKIKRSQLRFFAAKKLFFKTIFIIWTFLTFTYYLRSKNIFSACSIFREMAATRKLPLSWRSRFYTIRAKGAAASKFGFRMTSLKAYGFRSKEQGTNLKPILT